MKIDSITVRLDLDIEREYGAVRITLEGAEVERRYRRFKTSDALGTVPENVREQVAAGCRLTGPQPRVPASAKRHAIAAGTPSKPLGAGASRFRPEGVRGPPLPRPLDTAERGPTSIWETNLIRREALTRAERAALGDPWSHLPAQVLNAAFGGTPAASHRPELVIPPRRRLTTPSTPARRR